MPRKDFKFKSDEKIEKELKPIEIKGPRRYISPLFDVNNETVNCIHCNNKITSKCAINNEDCFYSGCPDCTDDKDLFFRCNHYIEPTCKEGYPFSTIEYMTCPTYDGPKIKHSIHFFDGENFHKIR